MKKLGIAAGAALLASSAMVQAGGIDRSGQSVALLFEEGTYAEISYGYVNPNVSGTDFTLQDTGDMAPAYSLIGGGFRTDLTDKISAALIVDQPFGASTNYTAGFWSLPTGAAPNTNATLNSTAITVLASYDISDRFMVYGGAVAQTLSADAAVNIFAYTVDAAADTGFGYVLGGAFQIPEYALRVSLTYRSGISTSHDTLEYGIIPSVTDITTPQSVNLEFQTGINPKTLVFGSVRWVDWSSFDMDPISYPDPSGDPLVSYDNDVVTYSLGVGRKLSDKLSAAITVGYEASTGGDATMLAPTDGYYSVGAGLTYTAGAAKITGGVKYVWIGDATVVAGANNTFTNNNALAFGLKIGFSM